jgi:hypothetical protein
MAPRWVRSGRIVPACAASFSFALPSGCFGMATAFSTNAPSMYANML